MPLQKASLLIRTRYVPYPNFDLGIPFPTQIRGSDHNEIWGALACVDGSKGDIDIVLLTIMI